MNTCGVSSKHFLSKQAFNLSSKFSHSSSFIRCESSKAPLDASRGAIFAIAFDEVTKHY